MAAQDGFTLVELLIAATLMGLVLTASLAALTSIQRGQAEVTSRTSELGQAQTGAERLTREIRQGSAVLAPVPATITTGGTAVSSTLSIKTRVYAAGTDTAATRTVTYTCSSGTCTRSVDGGTAAPVIRNVASDNVFTVAKNADGIVNYVSFSITVNSRGKSVTIADGVDMRNV